MKIAYLCDGLDTCSDRPGCYRFLKPGMAECHHTTNPEHAVNGTVDDPEKYPERFHQLDIFGDEDCYWEGDISI